MKFNFSFVFIISGTFAVIFTSNFTSALPIHDDFELSIIHINDFHARFEETNNQSLPCRQGQICIGGYSRMATVIKQLQKSHHNSIYLNAADNFQGTVWYNLFRYNVTAHFLNLLPADAIAIGNHEFAHNVEGLVPLLRKLTSPVVAANIDDSDEPQIQNLYKKSIVIERSGRKIGIVGAIYSKTNELAATGKLKFTDEVQAIREEAQRLKDQAINIIIALTHCGLNDDIKIATEVGDLVDIVVGGHSHSFLYSSNNSHFPGFDTVTNGPYPIVINPRNDRTKQVLVVQAFAFTRYVGDLRVVFDIHGNIKHFHGNPIFLGPNVEKDPQIEAELIPWREQVNEISQREIGSTNIDLLHAECWTGECALGSFTADTALAETQHMFPELNVMAAIVQTKGMRSSFPVGSITYGDVMTFFPFGNTFDILDVNGATLRDAFEYSMTQSLLHFSGIRVVFDNSLPVGSQVVSLKIKNEDDQFEDILDDKIYKVAVMSFIADGGDGYKMFERNKISQKIGLVGDEVMERYIKRKSPISYELDGRFVIRNKVARKY